MNNHSTAPPTIPWLDPENIAIPDASVMELSAETQAMIAEKVAAYEPEYDQAVIDLPEEQHQSLGLLDTVNTLQLSFHMRNPAPPRSRHPVLGYIAWLALCFAASTSAVFVSTGGWYAALHKPIWNPPAWVFGPAWTLLYILMATAAWLVWREGGWKAQSRALSLFVVQWLLNALWTPLFFGMHQTGLAFAEILLLWLMIALTLKAFWQVKPAAGLLMLPYLAWVTFAAALNFTIWHMNL